jgi:hypothetical protein
VFAILAGSRSPSTRRRFRRSSAFVRYGATSRPPIFNAPAVSVMRCLRFELLLKSLQIVSAHIGNRPIVEVGINPMQKLVTLA